MKLYLSSYGFGNQPERFIELIGENKRVGVIMNAQDYHPAEKRQPRLESELSGLTKLGLQPEELDLREYFNDQAALAGRLGTFGALWIRGGNVFMLRQAMVKSGFDGAAKPMVEDESLVYAGFSAGSCAASPNLYGIELVDDITVTATTAGYDAAPEWSGLGLINYAIAPHYRSDHYESAAIDNVVDYFKEQGIAYRALRDGQAIVINGTNSQLIS